MHRRNLLIALIALLVALPLTACSGKLPDPATAVKAATQNASKAKTVYMEATSIVGSGGEAFETTSKLAFDFENEKFWQKTELDPLGVMEARGLGGKLYLRVSDSDGWYVGEVSELGDLGEFASIFGGGADPLKMLEELGGNSSYAKADGHEEIRGKDAVRYVAIVPASELGTRSGIEAPDDSEVTFELWVSDGLPARFRVSFEFDFSKIDPDVPFSISMESATDFFDYGEPVDVELPPSDEIVGDLEDFWDASLDDDDFGGDPFEGADCYGDKVDDCLGVNAELDAKAADPALCQGAEARVCLVPVGNVRTDIVDAIVKFHKETANIDVLVLPSLALDSAAIHRATSQVDADTLYEMLQEHYGVGDLTPSTFIAITPIDVKPRDDAYGWMFGSRWGRDANGLHNHGVFSYFRMLHVEPYDGPGITDELIHLRASKYVGRYVALLYLDYPYTDDIEYLNYSDMYGFGDLDGIGTTWPTGDKPCEGDTPVVCIIPDGDYVDFLFEDDVKLAIEELASELGVRVEMRKYASYYMPSLDDWGDEYGGDLRETFPGLLAKPNVTVIGITDDPFAQARGVSPYMDRAWPGERLAVVSAADAGEAGNARHEDRVKALLLRAIAQVHYGQPLNSDPSSLLFEGVTRPSDLDGKTPPVLP